MDNSKPDQSLNPAPQAAALAVCTIVKVPTIEDMLSDVDAALGAKPSKHYEDPATGLISYEDLRLDGYPALFKHEQTFKLVYPELHEALMIMSRFSPLGNWLVGKAKERELTFSFSDGKSSLGSYSARHVKASRANSVALNVSILAHEIFHDVQQSHNAMVLSSHFNFRCQAAHELCAEAAAQTCAVRVAFEAKLNGYPDAFDYFDTEAATQAEVRYAALYHEFAHAYGSKMKQGATQEEALQAACDHTYQAYLDSQGMRDTYNSIVLTSFIRRVVRKPSQQMSDNSFDSDHAYERCRIDKERMLTSRPICPQTDREIFGANKLLRQAFEYADYINQMNYARGRSKGYLFHAIKRGKELEADENPYWQRRNKFSLERVLRAYDTRRGFYKGPIRLFEVLNEYAGILNATQLSLNFFHVAKAKEQNNAPQPHAGQLLLAAPKI